MNYWIFPANNSDYYAFDAFMEMRKLSWGQPTYLVNRVPKAGDEAFIYESGPKGAHALVLRVKILSMDNKKYIDDEKYQNPKSKLEFGVNGPWMEVEYLETLDKTMTLQKLKDNGVNSVQRTT